MLVLSRKAEEAVLVPSVSLTIRVLSIHGDKVRIGIEAPRELKVMREELLERETIPIRGTESDGPTTAA